MTQHRSRRTVGSALLLFKFGVSRCDGCRELRLARLHQGGRIGGHSKLAIDAVENCAYTLGRNGSFLDAAPKSGHRLLKPRSRPIAFDVLAREPREDACATLGLPILLDEGLCHLRAGGGALLVRCHLLVHTCDIFAGVNGGVDAQAT